MRIAVSGSSGLIGSAIAADLCAGGREVVPIVRPHDPRPDGVRWDPRLGTIDHAALEGVDAVVHVAGEPLAALRWSRAKRRRIRNSRVRGTDALARGIAAMSRKPAVLVSASAVGVYGDRGDERLDDDSQPGRGFLADVARDWEAAARPAADAGVRVVFLRIAPVVDARSPVIARMRLPLRLGLGAWFGAGRHFWPWIALADLVGAARMALDRDDLQGPLVAAAPHPVTNREFVTTFGRVLRRPVVLPLPAPLLRAALGEIAQEMLLSSQRVVPRKLLDAGYQFQRPDLEAALRAALAAG